MPAIADAGSLGTLDGPDVVHLERVEAGPGRHDVDRRPGRRIRAYGAALGHAQLAFLPAARQIAILESAERVKLSERTLTDLDALLDRLREVRAQGYAVSDGENAYGLRTVAAPVLDTAGDPVAGISFTIDARRMPVHEFVALAKPEVLHVAKRANGRRSQFRRRDWRRMAKATMTVTSLRLLADDLTGALDTAAELVGITALVHAFWHGAIPSVLPENAALDSGTRELDIASAVRIVNELAPTLTGAAIPFTKIDSLMRGPTLAEVAACVRAGNWDRGVLVPLLGLFGSDHPVAAEQLEACGPDWLRLREGGPGEAAAIVARFRAAGVPSSASGFLTGLVATRRHAALPRN